MVEWCGLLNRNCVLSAAIWVSIYHLQFWGFNRAESITFSISPLIHNTTSSAGVVLAHVMLTRIDSLMDTTSPCAAIEYFKFSSYDNSQNEPSSIQVDAFHNRECFFTFLRSAKLNVGASHSPVVTHVSADN